MADISHWEKQFVSAFVIESKRERYLTKLKGGKHRKEILNRLNHSLDYDPACATVLDNSLKYPSALLSFLLGHGVDPLDCHFMADGNPLDGNAMRLDRAVSELLDNHWGAIIICPPRPIAVYKQEDIGNLILLSKLSEIPHNKPMHPSGGSAAS